MKRKISSNASRDGPKVKRFNEGYGFFYNYTHAFPDEFGRVSYKN